MCSLLMLYLHWYIIAALTDNNNFFLSKNRSVEGKYWELNRVHFVEVIQKFYSAIDLVRKLCEKVISEKYSQKPLFMVLFTLKHFTTYVNGPFTHMCEHKSQFRSAVWEASGKRSQSPHDLGETNKNSHMVVIKNPTCSFCWPLNKFNEWLGNHFMNNSHICNIFLGRRRHTKNSNSKSDQFTLNFSWSHNIETTSTMGSATEQEYRLKWNNHR